jgi:(p)ppGpp synthase/HD superfamily hydrolase
MGYDKKIIIGAVLHDIIEDSNVTDEQLKDIFWKRSFRFSKSC